MNGRADVDDALARTGVDRGQRLALPTVAAFDHITTAGHHDDTNPKPRPAKADLIESRWVRFTSATRPESGSDLLRR
jgi:hypothetical protein